MRISPNTFIGWFRRTGAPARRVAEDAATRAERRARDKQYRADADARNRRMDRLRHSIPDKAVLQAVLPIRAEIAAYRSALPSAREREQQFRATSPAYDEVISARATDDPHLRPMTLDGLRWWVPLPDPDNAVLVERALGHQDFPYRVISQTRELALGGIMLDIGANTGRMSIPRVILGDVTASYCAEPDPRNYECLVRNVRDNGLTGLVLPDRVAIGAEHGIARLERGKSTGGHRVVEGDTVTRREVLEVEQITLDAWVERAGIDLRQVTFVKVDAQGSEVHILRGAPRVLACRHIAWQLEIDLETLAARKLGAQDLYEVFRRHFTHFIDLNRRAEGSRARTVADLETALSYVSGGSNGRTDVLLFNAGPPL
jgi:FkbM family methyltransferase